MSCKLYECGIYTFDQKMVLLECLGETEKEFVIDYWTNNSDNPCPTKIKGDILDAGCYVINPCVIKIPKGMGLLITSFKDYVIHELHLVPDSK